MWISKDGDVRKKELLDAALLLFSEKGYENTSINDIIEKVGVTKGSYYYYFKSKEDVLTELANKQSQIALNIVEKIADKPDINALEKISQIISEVFINRAQNMDLRLESFKSLAQETNTVLMTRILENVVKAGGPLIRSILDQGIREEIFEISYPEETAKLYIRLSNIINTDLLKAIIEFKQGQTTKETIKNILLFYEDAFNRLLGIKNGYLTLSDTVIKVLGEYKVI